ncbi:MAG: hypothetical protein JO083_01040 [Candidatus Eremiobacteraeota bacterium]|nr:hypothetical protein [Candidatus Eremiobacteraeota bacterium]MBV8371547.1 hypothetical protein [Candidatus Eremiobacteraeota bacterium]
MNEEKLNATIRRFLKEVGVTSQREIEKAVRAAIESGRSGETESCAATMTLEMPALGLRHVIQGKIES